MCLWNLHSWWQSYYERETENPSKLIPTRDTSFVLRRPSKSLETHNSLIQNWMWIPYTGRLKHHTVDVSLWVDFRQQYCLFRYTFHDLLRRNLILTELPVFETEDKVIPHTYVVSRVSTQVPNSRFCANRSFVLNLPCNFYESNGLPRLIYNKVK